MVDDSLALALEALRDRLRRDADRETRDAMLLECYALAGYSPTEIDERLGIDRETRKVIIARLKRALKRLDD